MRSNRGDLTSVQQNDEHGEEAISPQAMLVVDDDPAMLLQANGFLAEADIPAILEQDGGRALAWIRRRRFPWILTDLALPNCSGFVLLREVRRIWGDGCRVVAMTATHWLGRPFLAQVGFDDCLFKPLEPQAVESLLQHCRPRGGLPSAPARR
jgi:DNA-binding response OmpR family regulator